MTTHTDKQLLWYTRRDGVVRGPYPGRQISRYILLGRIRGDDELRPENGRWASLEHYPALVPEVMKLPDTPENRERLRQARLHEDERTPGDRRERAGPVPPDVQDRRSGRERRRPEPDEVLRHRELKYRIVHQARRRRHLYLYPLWVAGLVLAGFLLSLLLETFEPEEADQDCSAAPRPGVNWNHCDLTGARLQAADLVGAHLDSAQLKLAQLAGARLTGAEMPYAQLDMADLTGADLSHARLTGATLRGARLRGTRFVGADLSWANLTGADLEDTRLEDAILDQAIWIDGRVCARASRGVCRLTPPAADR